jgi:hypothetical protein
MDNLFVKKSNEAYLAQIGFSIVILMILTVIIMWWFQYSWWVTLLISYLIGFLVYVLLATDHILSAVFLNLISKTGLFDQIVVGSVGIIGLLIVSPPVLLIDWIIS